jgi:hypothetical protein
MHKGYLICWVGGRAKYPVLSKHRCSCALFKSRPTIGDPTMADHFTKRPSHHTQKNLQKQPHLISFPAEDVPRMLNRSCALVPGAALGPDRRRRLYGTRASYVVVRIPSTASTLNLRLCTVAPPGTDGSAAAGTTRTSPHAAPSIRRGQSRGVPGPCTIAGLR